MLSLWLIFKFQNRFLGFEVYRAGVELIWWFIVGWLDGSWVGWGIVFVSWLVSIEFIVRLVGWFLNFLVSRSICWLVGWFVG